MTVANFFNKTVYIQRLKLSGYKSSFYGTATADASIQQVDLATSQRLGITQDRSWMGYFEEDTNIQKGDRITDNVTGINYEVKGKTAVDWGTNRHIEVILEETNA